MAVGICQRPDPDRKILLLAAVICGREFIPSLDEVLDVGVIAVILSSFFTDFLEEERDMLTVFSKMGARNPEGEEVFIRSC